MRQRGPAAIDPAQSSRGLSHTVLDPPSRIGVEEMQTRGIRHDPHTVTAADRRPSGDPSHDRPLLAGQTRPPMHIGIGTEFLDEIDRDCEPVLALGAQVLGTYPNGDRLTRDLPALVRGEFDLHIAEAQRRPLETDLDEVHRRASR